MSTLAPFRFLDLPKELRFIIYENLSTCTKELRLLPSESGFLIEQQTTKLQDNQPAITITLLTLPVQILSTCTLVHSEAIPFLSRKLDKMSETIPKVIIDADCLYTPAFTSTQDLLRAILNNLNQHPFFTHKPTTPCSPPKQIEPPLQYPKQIHQWLAQTTHLLLSQKPTLCPLSGFMGTRSYPTVRLVLEVPKLWRSCTHRGLAIESRANGAESRGNDATPLYTASVTSRLSELYSKLAEYTKGLEHVKSAAIVFGVEEGRVLTREGVVVRKVAGLDFGICRVG